MVFYLGEILLLGPLRRAAGKGGRIWSWWGNVEEGKMGLSVEGLFWWIWRVVWKGKWVLWEKD